MSGVATIANAVTKAQAVLDLVVLKMRTSEPLRGEQVFTLFVAANLANEYLDAMHDALIATVLLASGGER